MRINTHEELKALPIGSKVYWADRGKRIRTYTKIANSGFFTWKAEQGSEAWFTIESNMPISLSALNLGPGLETEDPLELLGRTFGTRDI